jgi:hypothetical protein
VQYLTELTSGWPHLLDLIAELKVQIKRLEAEVLALKREQTKKRATAA